MYATSVENFQQGFIETIRMVMENGDTVTVRDKETRELRTMVMNVKFPYQRVMCVPGRNNNIFAAIAETLWVLAGRNDISFLGRYLPRASEFSDDGLTWRAGYGTRIRNYRGDIINYSIDQLSENVKLLLDDPDTRRAVISIWDPALDFLKSKDIPCNNWIHSMIRNDKLHMSVAVRSNDAIWGASGINWFEWSVMMELMASCVMIQSCKNSHIGEMNYLADSYHIYQQHYPRVQRILDSVGVTGICSVYDLGYENIPIRATGLSSWTNQLRNLLWHAENEILFVNNLVDIDDPFLLECAYMLMIHKAMTVENGAYKYSQVSLIVNDLLNQDGDFRAAALEYLHRQDDWDIMKSVINLTQRDIEFLYMFDKK